MREHPGNQHLWKEEEGTGVGRKPRTPRTVLADATGTLKLAWPLESSPDKLNWLGFYIPAFISY